MLIRVIQSHIWTDYIQGTQDKLRLPDTCARGGQGDRISSGFEPAKALVRRLLYCYPDSPSFQSQLGSHQSYDLSGESAQAYGLATGSET